MPLLEDALADYIQFRMLKPYGFASINWNRSPAAHRARPIAFVLPIVKALWSASVD